MQKFQVIGNICNDLELQETASGTPLLKFGIAVRRDYSRGDDERQTDFFDVICWNKCAESIARYCKKGDKIYLEGRIETRSYEDNQGIKRKAIDFIVDKQEFLGSKKERSEETDEPTDDWAKPRRKKPTMQPMDDDGDIPFN